MALPASEELRELERQLVVAAERGDTITRGAVQQEFGLGAGVVDEMLDALREHGKAVEVAPGEWRGPTLDEMDRPVEPGPVVVRVPDEAAEEPIEDRPGALEAALPSPQWQSYPTVRITRSIVEALDPEALGKLVHAGLSDLGPGEVFLLEVTP